MTNRFTDYILSIDSQKRKEKILQLSAIPSISMSLDDIHLLRELVLFESNSILDNHGQIFNVKSGKSDWKNQKLGLCYNNAAQKMSKGFEYVEGYCVRKKDGLKFGHAWNVDKHGTHLDFSLPNSEEYDYFGMVIPSKLVYAVGFRNSGVWYSALPFIDEIELTSIASEA
ncbi:MAG: hypothetical protein NTU98_07970 [Bacteroidetes bacterium]|nr:hypothetical protein [Bacteroidota bacterium]